MSFLSVLTLAHPHLLPTGVWLTLPLLGQAFTWLFALRPIPSCAEHQGGGLRYGADVVCRERPIQRTEVVGTDSRQGQATEP